MSLFTKREPYRYEDRETWSRLSPSEHIVEDTRTAPALRSDDGSRSQAQQRRPKRGKTLMIVLITVFAFSLTLIAADLLTGKATIAEYVSLFTSKKTEKAEVYYAVYAMSTENMSLAYKNAATVRTEGGAGYVLKNETMYYVILNTYLNESDAKSVASKEANYGIYEIPTATIKLNIDGFSFPEQTKDVSREAYLVLYEAANDLASHKYGEEDMKRVLEKQREKVVTAMDLYAESIRGKEDNIRIDYKVLLSEIKGAFDNLLTNSNYLVADARYYAVMILHSYAQFTTKYAD